MCQIKQKLLLVLLSFLFLLQPVSGLAISLTKLTIQDPLTNFQSYSEQGQLQPNIYMMSLSNDSETLTELTDNLNQSQTPSTNAASLLNNQDKLLDNLEGQWEKLEQQVQTLEIQSSSLKTDNAELRNMLNNSKQTIVDLRKNLDEYKAALQSNKEDTGYIVSLFAEAQEELNNIKTYVAKLEKDKRHLRNVRFTCIGFTAVGIGSIILANSLPIDQRIKDYLNGIGIGMIVAGGTSLGISFLF